MTHATMMKRTILSALFFALLAGCHDTRQPNQASLERAMGDYLDKRGDLCVAKSSWPVDVSEQEARAGSRNALQMPVLERLGLVGGSDATVEQRGEDGVATTARVRRYQLTTEGRKYYLARPAHKNPTGNRFADAAHDFCAAHLSLDKVVGWEASARPGSTRPEAVVTYTYHVKPAPWATDPAVRAVFPMVDAVIRGAGALQLKETVVLGAAGWEAGDL
jgi:hypothetical protein